MNARDLTVVLPMATRRRLRGLLRREQYPACLQRSHALKGVFVGGCVERGVGSSFRAKAHAQSHGPYRGWICVRKAERLADDMLMIHELAHVVTGQGHTDTWRRKVLELGGTLDATASLRSYQKGACSRVHELAQPGVALPANAQADTESGDDARIPLDYHDSQPKI